MRDGHGKPSGRGAPRGRRRARATPPRARRPELADSVEALEIRGKCRCGEGYCASFYAAEPTSPDESLYLEGDRGDLIVEVADGKITFVEVLFWSEPTGGRYAKKRHQRA